MTQQQIFDYTGDHAEAGDVASGVHITVKKGGLVIEGNVGDNVTLDVEGPVTVKGKIGDCFKASAQGSFTAEEVGTDAEIASLDKVSVEDMGERSWIKGKFGAGVRGEHVKCGDFKVVLQHAPGNQYIQLIRKSPDQVDDPDSCFNPVIASGPSLH